MGPISKNGLTVSSYASDASNGITGIANEPVRKIFKVWTPLLTPIKLG